MLLKLQLFGRNGAALAPVYCCKMPHNIQLISFIIVILNPIIDFVFYFSEISALGNIYFILHVTKERFLWRIVPSVTSSAHRLSEIIIIYNLNEAITTVMRPLITMYNCFF